MDALAKNSDGTIRYSQAAVKWAAKAMRLKGIPKNEVSLAAKLMARHKKVKRALKNGEVLEPGLQLVRPPTEEEGGNETNDDDNLF